MLMQLIEPLALRQKMVDGSELALIDVREEGEFGKSHILTACCIPQRLLELRILDLVPSPGVRLVICDDGANQQALACEVAEQLEVSGYTNVSVLAGGTSAWAKHGLELFSGVNVPSKAFGEYVELNRATPHISAIELAELQAGTDSLVVLDSRPTAEYTNMSIPGGIDCPGAELVYRAHVAAPDPDTKIIVNCAGRTRSIIGAQSLINAGVPNPVMALENGTMGWQLAGLKVATGMTQMVPEPHGAALDVATDRANKVAADYGVSSILNTEFMELKADPERTLYLFDVRSAQEYAQGHHPDARCAPGGQLIQATDEYIAVRNAIVVTTDDNGVRAKMTASWLKQMGWNEVFVLDNRDREMTRGHRAARLLNFEEWQSINAQELRAVLDSGESCEVLDLSSSVEFRTGHIPGSWWSSRTRLTTDLAFRPAPGLLVLTSSDAVIGHYCAPVVNELQRDAQLRVLDGGNSAWAAAGFELQSGDVENGPPEDSNDVFHKPYDYSDSVEQRMQAYLDWEIALTEKVNRDGILNFDQIRKDCLTGESAT